jgi:hypothetical protein
VIELSADLPSGGDDFSRERMVRVAELARESRRTADQHGDLGADRRSQLCEVSRAAHPDIAVSTEFGDEPAE